MEKIWVITGDQIENFTEVAKTVYWRDFRDRGISEDRIATTDSFREEFVSKCCAELKIETLGDKLVWSLLNARKGTKSEA